MIVVRKTVIIIDLGGVVVEKADRFLREDPLLAVKDAHTVPVVEGCFEVTTELASVCELYFCAMIQYKTLRQKTTEWLDRKGFFTIPGISPESVHYTDTRDEKTKVALDHSATHAIDDNMEVLHGMSGHVPKLFGFRISPLKQKEMPFTTSQIMLVDSWSEIRKKFQEERILPPPVTP